MGFETQDTGLMADEPELHDVPLQSPENESPDMPVLQSTEVQPDENGATAGISSTATAGQGVKKNTKQPKLRSPHQSGSAHNNASRVLNHSQDSLKQLTYLEILMADKNETITDRDVVYSVLNVVCVHNYVPYVINQRCHLPLMYC